jgi:glycosyltransferase involved in cell wall biosynthesis
VHHGGGRTLLLSILTNLRAPSVAILDSRMDAGKSVGPGVTVHRVRPSLGDRLRAELRLRRLAGAASVVLCFGNLPPLFARPTRVFVFLHNRYLLAGTPLHSLPLRTRLRIVCERLWLRIFLRDAEVVVQTPSMAEGVYRMLGRKAKVSAFAPTMLDIASTTSTASMTFVDFIYVASGEPHKNHRRLLLAWKELVEAGETPSLRLTLSTEEQRPLSDLLNELQTLGARVECIGSVEPSAIPSLYAHAHALIYPSLFESFGLPLLEAQRAGLPIIASDLDYVHDVATPEQTFDPETPRSIARAVRRFLGRPPVPPPVADVTGFFKDLGLAG